MRGSGRTVVGLVAAGTLVLGLTTTAAATPEAATPQPAAEAGDAEAPLAGIGPGDGSAGCPTRLLDEPLSGEEVVAQLGDAGLAEAARRNDEEPGELQAHLEADDALHVDACGRLFWVDRLPDHHDHHDHDHAHGSGGLELDDRPADGGQAAAASGPWDDHPLTYPQSETFKLNSRPGSNRTIYLDFTGTTLTGTYWNSWGSAAPDGYVLPPFSVDADTTTFSEIDHAFIQTIWLVVAEDFAPFDVNVTTQDPGIDAIRRTNEADQVYGTRALITNDTGSWAQWCYCAGMAHDNNFQTWGVRPDGTFEHDYYQPGSINLTGATEAEPYGMWVDGGPINIANTISHEVGHNFGLPHHGRNADEHGYHTGQGLWAPIMGGSYAHPLQQWATGDYGDYNGIGLDDVATIGQNGAPLAADDHGRSPAQATVLTGPQPLEATGTIGTRTDRDWFRFQANGTTTIAVTGAPTSPNLDIELRLYDGDASTVRATVDPPSYLIDASVAGGLDAVTTVSLPPGTYFARIRGVGSGNPLVSGYSDYGSLGAYQLSVVHDGLPDLRVPQLSDPPATTSPGGSFPVTDRTRNFGDATAGSSVTRYYLTSAKQLAGTDRRLEGVRNIPTLGAGAFDHGQTTVTVPSDHPSGVFWLAACADDTEVVVESNEANNCRWSTTQVQVGGMTALPDLRVVQLADPPANVTAGATFSVTDRTRNIGEATADASRTRYWLTEQKNLTSASRILAGVRQVPELSPGQWHQGARNVTVPTNVAPGRYWLMACADAPDQIVESNEDNNCRWSSSRVRIDEPLPDLRVVQLTDPPAAAAPGTSFSVTDRTRNIGEATAGESRTRYWLTAERNLTSASRILAGVRHIPELSPGQWHQGARNVTVPTNVAPGRYWLMACADAPNQIVESNEDNNCRWSSTRVRIVG